MTKSNLTARNLSVQPVYSRMPKWDSSSSYYVADLAMFDMISVELVQDRATVGVDSDSNIFQIEKIN